MKKHIPVGLAVLVALCTAASASLVVYDQSNPPDTDGLPSGGWGTYRGFSATLSDTALSQAASGLEEGTTLADYETVFLTGLLLRHAGSQGAAPAAPTGDWTQAWLKVYTTQTPSAASWVGDSAEYNDMSYGGEERNVAYSFNNLALDPDTKYYFYFANTLGGGDVADVTYSSGRMRVSNNVDHTHDGNLYNPSWGAQDTAYDAIFAATVSSVPEPSTFVLVAAGCGVALMARRRRR